MRRNREISRTAVASLLAALAVAFLPSSRVRAQASEAAGQAAHYIVFERQGTEIVPVYYRSVRLSVPLTSLDETQLDKALAKTSRSSEQMAVTLEAGGAQVVYRNVVSISPWLRAEFHGPQEGDPIDGRWLSQENTAFVVRVPEGEATTLVLQDPVSQEVSRFDLLQLVARTPVIETQSEVLPTSVLSGPASNRVDLLFMGDGYTSPQSSEFASDAAWVASDFFSIEPYATYQNYFNVWALFTASAQSGADHPPYVAGCSSPPSCCGDPAMQGDPLAGTMVNTAFDATFCTANIHRLLTVNVGKVYAAAAAVPDWDTIIVLVNDATYGGAGGSISIISLHASAPEIAQHEIGHSFVGLADEYTSAYPGYPTCSDITWPPCESNVTDVTSRAQIKWNPWISGSTPVPTPNTGLYASAVGLFQGARYFPSGMYRSGSNCIMRTLGAPFCQVPSQSFVLTLYEGFSGTPAGGISLVEPGTLQPETPSFCLTHPASQVFQASVLSPAGGPLVQVTWFNNGVPIPGATGSSYTFDTSPDDPADVEIRLQVQDVTTLVNPTMGGDALQEEYTWNVRVITSTSSEGDCCSPSGTCTVTTAEACVPPSTWIGGCTACSPNLCPLPDGACCTPGGSCAVTTDAACLYPDIWEGEGTPCDPNPCSQPTGRCCATDGSCTMTLEALCAGTWTTFLSCTPNVCLPVSPNAGGVLWVHDTGIVYSSDLAQPIVSTPPTACACVDNQQSPDAVGRVWKVYAAFPAGTQVRLKSVAWGIQFPDATTSPYAYVSVNSAGCGLPNADGPGTDTSAQEYGFPSTSGGMIDQSFPTGPRTTNLVELYYFTGSAYVAPSGPPVTFSVVPHVNAGRRYFFDDANPQRQAPIAGYGSLGFGQAGTTPCPEFAATPGACCDRSTGLCEITAEIDCLFDWLGACAPCSVETCWPPSGACCAPEGTCTVTLQAACVSPSTWHVAWTTCSPNPCPQPTGACCALDGTCAVTEQAACVSPDIWHGESQTCTPNPCPQPSGACCTPEGECAVTLQAACESPNTWHLEWTTCSPNPCPVPAGACCSADGNCTLGPNAVCLESGGTYQGNGTACTPNPCPQPQGACCVEATCTITTQASCTGQWRGAGAVCAPNPCGPTGACCLADLTCVVRTWEECAFQGGQAYMGNGSVCEPDPCPTAGVGDSRLATITTIRSAPNPFGGGTTLYLSGPPAAAARVLVFDAVGRLVRTAWEGSLDGREVAIGWDGKDQWGHETPAGIYLVRVDSSGGEALVRLVKTR